MKVSLVLTLIGEDKPGLVELVSETVAEHEGNWLESRMSRMAGRFAGILRASVPAQRWDELARALVALESRGIRVLVERSDDEDATAGFRWASLDLVGADRAGIVRDVSRALARFGVNVGELHTSCASAPMSGELLFNVRASLQVPLALSIAELEAALEEIADDLMVDVSLEELAEPDVPSRS